MVLFEFKVRRYERTVPARPHFSRPALCSAWEWADMFEPCPFESNPAGKVNVRSPPNMLFSNLKPWLGLGVSSHHSTVHVVIVVNCDSESEAIKQRILDDMPDM